MKEAQFYKKLPAAKVKCELCPHNCLILPDSTGICRCRKNIDGILYALNYGLTVTICADPMEKKPLYHFYPGSNILSVGANSCNFHCDFCQNYSISQFTTETHELTPDKLVQLCRNHNLEFVAFTYTEPITWFEFVLEASRLLQESGIKTVMVTNGFINQKPLQLLLPHIDAMNIDLKSMDSDFYKNICGGDLAPVLETIKIAAKQVHVEITNLLVTGENDTPEQIQRLVYFLASVNPDIPLHFSKYFPQFQRSNEPTSDGTMQMALEIGKEKLSNVYLGNIFSNKNTTCPECKAVIIYRNNRVKSYIEHNCCPYCGTRIYGVFS